MSEDHLPPGMYDEPQERLTRIAGAMSKALINHPENGDDIRAAFMIRDEEGGHGAALYGYPEGQETSIKTLSDVVDHISILFKAAGIEMEVVTVTRQDPDTLLDGPEAPVEEAIGKPKVVLTITADEPDPRMAELCKAVKEAVEGTSGLNDTKLILVMSLGSDSSAVMHHGYEDNHHMAHGLFDAFQRTVAAEGGQVMVMPIMDPGTLN